MARLCREGGGPDSPERRPSCRTLPERLLLELRRLLNLYLSRQQLDDLLESLKFLQLDRRQLLQVLKLLRHDLQQRKHHLLQYPAGPAENAGLAMIELSGALTSGGLCMYGWNP